MIGFNISIWTSLIGTSPSPPPETFYIITEDGNGITDELGNPLITE